MKKVFGDQKCSLSLQTSVWTGRCVCLTDSLGNRSTGTQHKHKIKKLAGNCSL